ncbi:MAG: hypothetical protein IJ237_01580, partial [Oscillospiraceae bacterium]|nr:hypothetical protein [Oscillospiraceae bacterium]
CTEWRADFSPDEGEKSQEYFVYFKILKQNQTENLPPECVRRFIQRFPNLEVKCCPASSLQSTGNDD